MDRDPDDRELQPGADQDGMVPPLFVSEGGIDVSVFLSRDELLGYLEPWFPTWVPDYRAYDSRGLRLELYTDAPLVSSERSVLGWSTDNAHQLELMVRPAETEPTHQSDLRALLTAGRIADPANDDATLEELVATVVARQQALRSRPRATRRLLDGVSKRLAQVCKTERP